MGQFDGKMVLITGASSGIGEALAREFAHQGAAVALVARRRERLDALRAEIEAAGGRAAVFPCDVTDAEAIRQAAEEAAKTFGGIDVAVANAGFGVAGQITSLTVEDYRRQFELNYFGTLNTIYAVLPWLEKSRGRLVLLGSVAGKVFTPSTSAYNSSKAAIIGLAESIWHELDEIGVSVTCVNPGFVASEIRSVDNYGRYTGNPDPVPSWLVMPAEQAARLIIRAVWRRKPEYIVTFHGKLAVWLQRHFPGLVRWLIRVATRGRLEKVRKMRRNTGS